MAYGTGVVEAAGAEVTELKLGDHVVPGQTGPAAHVADRVDA
jgi:DHA1 family inner membrane transport protein